MSTLLNIHTSNNSQEKFIRPSLRELDIENRGLFLPAAYHKKLGIVGGLLFQVIVNLSQKFNYCYASTAQLSKILGLPVSTLEDHLKKLEDKKVIYRNTWHRPGGKTRHIIPETHYLKYRQSWMQKKNIPKEVKDAYDKLIFYVSSDAESKIVKTPSPKYQTTILPTLKIRGSIHGTTESVGVLKNTTYSINNSGNYSGTSPPSFLEKLKKELEKRPEDWHNVLELMKWDEEHIRSRKNPAAYIVTLIQTGGIHDRIARGKKTRTETKEASEAAEAKAKRKELGIRLCEKARSALEQSGRTDISLRFDDVSWCVDYRETNRAFSVGWACEKDSVERLNRWLLKENINLGETNE